MLIKNCTLVNVKSGELISAANILIEKGKVAVINQESSFQVPAGTEVTDGSGLFAIPGLIDCHVHMVWDGSDDPNSVILGMDDELLAVATAKHAEATLKLGITTIRDLGAPRNVGFAVREAIRRGLIAGPNFLIAGPPICMTGGHVHTLGVEADGVDAVRKATRQLLKQGVDVIKLMASGGIYTEGEEPASPQLNLDELTAAVEEAHKRNVKVAAHAEGVTGIRNALKAGVDTLEHGNLGDEKAWEMCVKQGTYLSPTLVVFKYIAAAVGEGTPEFAVRKAQAMHKGQVNNFRKAVEMGVKIVVGTDAYSPRTPHECYFDELKYMHELGMTKLAVLQAASVNAADALDRDDLGCIEPGKRADLLLLSTNPLEDLDIGGKIVTIIKDGAVITR